MPCLSHGLLLASWGVIVEASLPVVAAGNRTLLLCVRGKKGGVTVHWQKIKKKIGMIVVINRWAVIYLLTLMVLMQITQKQFSSFFFLLASSRWDVKYINVTNVRNVSRKSDM